MVRVRKSDSCQSVMPVVIARGRHSFETDLYSFSVELQ